MLAPAVKQVAIVYFHTDALNADLIRGLGHPAPRVIRYQVTLDPARLSPSAAYIRFGQWSDNLGAGDEITGWQPISDVVIEEILAEWDGEEFRPSVPNQDAAEAA